MDTMSSPLKGKHENYLIVFAFLIYYNLDILAMVFSFFLYSFYIFGSISQF